MILWQVGMAVLFVCFFVIVFRGAPYVPTKKRVIADIFELYSFKKGDRLVDLGSGDGEVLVEAGKRSVRATGFELNPFLFGISWWRLRIYRRHANVRMADYWLTHLPSDTKVVFVFLASPFMKKLDRYLEDEAERLGHDLLLISNGMSIEGKTPTTKKGSLLTYVYKA